MICDIVIDSIQFTSKDLNDSGFKHTTNTVVLLYQIRTEIIIV